MPLSLYNTLTKKEELFVPSHPPIVTMYTCGPTVYGRAHIGNFSSYLMADLLKRWLKTSDYRVQHVMNITDVGHLVADADSGEDKVEKKAREEFGAVTHETVLKIARGYEEQFIADEKLLNIIPPDERPRASEYVEKMKDMIGVLLQKDIAYVTEDGIYYDVSRFPHYGALSGNSVDAMKSGARIETREGKRHPADFALWKFCTGTNEHHALRWTSPLGPSGETFPEGFPGWHIECSAMSAALLGQQIDLHTGGEDNIFPHHECEIAQSEAVAGKSPFVKYWVHKRRIDLAGEKMSKSLGNVLTLDQIIAKGFSPLDLRYYLLSVHYRTNLKFAWKGMEDARKARLKIAEWIREMKRVHREGAYGDRTDEVGVTAMHTLEVAMDADLNTPAALASVFSTMNHYYAHAPFEEKSHLSFIDFSTRAEYVFDCFESEEGEIPVEVLERVRQIDEARARKDFATSDRIRDALVAEGYSVKVTGEGTRVMHK